MPVGETLDELLEDVEDEDDEVGGDEELWERLVEEVELECKDELGEEADVKTK